MVHLDKVEDIGSMILHEDGSIISSSGDLSNNQDAAQAILNLLTHSLQVDFSAAHSHDGGQNGYVNAGIVHDNGQGAGNHKWNRITVSFDSHVYSITLSNKRITVLKKDTKPEGAPLTMDPNNPILE